MKTILQFLVIKEIAEQEFYKMSAEDQAGIYNELNVSNAKAYKELEESGADLKEALKTIADNQAEAVKTIMGTVEKQGIAISKLINRTASQEVSTMADELTEKKADIIAVAKGINVGGEVAIKAMTNLASVVNNDAAFNVSGVGQLGIRQLTMYDMFPKVQVSGSNINSDIKYWDWDEATIVRAAAMVAEGTAFPESTAKFEQFTCPMRKVGDSLPVTEEFMEDESMFASELELFLRINVDLEVDNQLLNGDNTGQNLKGLNLSAPVFATASAGITDPSIYDLIVIMKEAITTNRGSKYRPDFAIMNIADINKMKLKKDAQNNYVIPPFVDRNGNQVDGILVIENNGQVANTMVLGDSRFPRIYENGGFTLSKGLVNNQFLEDTMTIKVRKRLALLVREADKTGLIQSANIATDTAGLA